MSKPEKKIYRKMVFKTDPKMSIQLPLDVHLDLVNWAKKNARTKNNEVVARLIATLEQNDKFMSKDRLVRLIMSKKLAYKEEK
ncbi:MAG: hypothetical protein K0S29_1229 [Gammaproteobacteria bacterium]|nr:hypothetical protein [Gammaproteobacteria bacterium]